MGDTAQFAAQSVNGTRLITHAGRQTMATIEDFSQVQMRSGYAQVRLDPAFAGLIDQHITYMVFVTPEGDNRGIYVARETYAGFTLRESGGGRSTLPLSYRIVAHAFGAGDSRFKVAQRPLPFRHAGLLRVMRPSESCTSKRSSRRGQARTRSDFTARFEGLRKRRPSIRVSRSSIGPI